MVTTKDLGRGTDGGSGAHTSTSGAIDADVHPNFRDGVRDLEPYIDGASWRKRMGLNQATAWSGQMAGNAVTLPTTSYVNPGGSMRLDAVPPDGGPPGSDPAHTAKDLLDRHDLGAANLIATNILGLGGLPDPELAAEFAAAYNRWLQDVWLSADPRFKGAIAVAPQDPHSAASEIQRWASYPGRVAVYIPAFVGQTFGKRHYYPIYEAAEHYDLPITFHSGGESAGVNSAIIGAGVPTYYMEWHCSLPQIYQSHLVSLVVEGVFERFPALRAAFLEAGFAWLIHIMWRMDKNWWALREDVPWLKRPPSEYILKHIRVTSQPLYEPDDPQHLRQVMDIVHADEILMFSTDYPHWDTDDPILGLRRIPRETRHRMMHDNPRAFYRM